MQIAKIVFKILYAIPLRPMVRELIEVAEVFSISLDPISESCLHTSSLAHLTLSGEQYFLVETWAKLASANQSPRQTNASARPPG